VESDCELPGPLQLLDENTRVELLGAVGGPITAIRVSQSVPDYRLHLPAFDKTTTPPTIRFNAPPVEEELLEILWHFESIGAFWLGIQRIHWEVAQREWIPESDDERGQLGFFSMSGGQVIYQPARTPIIPPLAEELLRFRARFTDLVLPMSFFREGMNDYRRHRYINAFVNFYFFIEDLYGQGNTKNRLILRAFASSDELKWAVNKSRADLKGYPDQEHGFQFLCERMNRTLGEGPDDLLDLIVSVRGNLHHFSGRKSTLKGHPLNHAMFRSIAFLLLGTCMNCATKVLPRAGRGVGGSSA
jgi:hypothetical protein